MIKFKSGMTFIVMVLGCLALPAIVAGAESTKADDAEAEFNIKDEGVKKGNIFDIIFGSAPLMPTENGTLIVDSYLDENNNQKWDDGEKPLDKVVLCVIDEIEYLVPAFIPGLENGTNYSLKFSSSAYEPSVKQKNIFIKKRGEIIRIDVPCRPFAEPSEKPRSQAG